MVVDKSINIISFNIAIYRRLDHSQDLDLGHAYISSFEAILAIYRRFNGRPKNRDRQPIRHNLYSYARRNRHEILFSCMRNE